MLLKVDGGITKDAIVELLFRKQERGSDVIINAVGRDNKVHGRILSAGIERVVVKTDNGTEEISVDDIIEID